MGWYCRRRMIWWSKRQGCRDAGEGCKERRKNLCQRFEEGTPMCSAAKSERQSVAPVLFLADQWMMAPIKTDELTSRGAKATLASTTKGQTVADIAAHTSSRRTESVFL